MVTLTKHRLTNRKNKKLTLVGIMLVMNNSKILGSITYLFSVFKSYFVLYIEFEIH